MKFGDRLKLLLEESEITQKELASNLNIAPSTVSSYVQNAREPDFVMLKQIATFFDVSIDYLLDYNYNKKITTQENEMLRVFRLLSNENKAICVEQCKAFLKFNKKTK